MKNTIVDQILKKSSKKLYSQLFQNSLMKTMDEKSLENSKDLTITYKDKEVKIGELSEEEKIDCISRLWLYKGLVEDELEKNKEMIQKMYFFGKMEKLEEENND